MPKLDPQTKRNSLRLLAEADFNVTFVAMTLRDHGYVVEAADLEQIARVIIDRRNSIEDNIPSDEPL